MANCVQNIFNDFPYKGNRPLLLAICVVENRHAGNMRRAGRRQTKACIILKWCFSLFVLSQCVTCSPACTLCCQKWQTVGNSIIFCLSCNGRVQQNLYFEDKRINYFAPVWNNAWIICGQAVLLPSLFWRRGKRTKRKMSAWSKEEPMMTETMSCKLDLYATSKYHRALWITEWNFTKL